MQPPQHYLARFEEKVELNQRFTHYSFELQHPLSLDFLAGQYFSVQVSDQGIRRSYSICSSPDIKHGFEFLVDKAPAGVGCQFFANLQFGQNIEALGPLGMFVMVDDPAEKEVVLVANGSGIAPFRAMILNQLQVHHDQRKITLLWGMRHETDLFWELEFQQLSQAFANFEFVPIISQPIAGWPLLIGRVTDYLQKAQLTGSVGYYLCGSTAMINDVKNILQAKDVATNFIHHEKFY